MKKNFGTKLIIIVFTAFIAIWGLLYAFMPKREFSETEKRYLAQAPKLTADSLKKGTFSKDFESFMADQTPLRSAFVSINAYFELMKGNNGSNGVYLGKDGMLIEKPFARENRLETNLERIVSFVSGHKIPASLVAVPSKGYICSDKLPKNAQKYLDGEYNEFIRNTVFGKMKFVDVTKAFLNADDKKSLYYKTDHHWTSRGAFTAYEALSFDLGWPAVSSFRYELPNEENYSIETYDGFYGTSYAKSCYTLTKPDNVELWINKKTQGKAKVIIKEGRKETVSDSMFFRNHLTESDRYLTFLDGNHSLVKVETGNEGRTLLLIKDSFAHSIVPFLADNYSRIIMVDLRYYSAGLNKLIEEENVNEIMFLYSIENLATSMDIFFD